MTQAQSFYEMSSMLLTDLSFLLILLPLFVLAYYLAPIKLRPIVLLCESLFFFWRAESLDHMLGMLASIAFDFLMLRLMMRFDANERVRGWCLGVSVVKGIGLILYFGMLSQAQSLPLRLGLQIYTLSAIACLLAAWRREIPYEREFTRFALYCCFFPRLFAGPLMPYADFTRDIGTIRLSPEKVLSGGGCYIKGAFKALILGGSLYSLQLSAARLSEATALSSWLEVFSAAFALYYMLSGFCDMARGLGGMFGVELPLNFYYPFQSRSVEDFLGRFNISVGDFLRETVRIGPRGDKPGALWASVNIAASCALMGLWFGLRPAYLLWGLYLALFVVMERYLYPRLLAAMPTLFSRLGTLCIVLAGFTIFVGGSLTEALELVRVMLGANGFYNNQVLYLLTSNWLLLIVSCFFATNAVSLAIVKLRRAAPRVTAAFCGVSDAVILLLYIALSL